MRKEQFSDSAYTLPPGATAHITSFPPPPLISAVPCACICVASMMPFDDEPPSTCWTLAAGGNCMASPACATTRQRRSILLASFPDRKVRCELPLQGASSGCSLRAQIEKHIICALRYSDGRCEIFFSYRAWRPMARMLRLPIGGSWCAASLRLHGVRGAEFGECLYVGMIAESLSQLGCTGPCCAASSSPFPAACTTLAANLVAFLFAVTLRRPCPASLGAALVCSVGPTAAVLPVWNPARPKPWL